MGDIITLGSALYSMLDAASTVPIYYGIAPQGSACPFIIADREGATDDYAFAGGHTIDATYTVLAVSDKQWPTEAANLYESLHAAIDGSNPNVGSGFSVILFRRESTTQYRDNDGYWFVGGTYRLWVNDL